MRSNSGKADPFTTLLLIVLVLIAMWGSAVLTTLFIDQIRESQPLDGNRGKTSSSTTTTLAPSYTRVIGGTKVVGFSAAIEERGVIGCSCHEKEDSLINCTCGWRRTLP